MTSPSNNPEGKPLLYGPDNKPLPLSEKLTLKSPSHKKKTPRRKDKGTPRPRPLLRAALWTLSSAVTLVGFVAALLTLLPRLSLFVSDPVDPTNPFSASFTIINSGYVPLYAVAPRICLGEIGFGNAQPSKRNWDYGVTCLPPLQKWQMKEMAIDDRKTFAINEELTLNGHFAEADIAVGVDYELPLPFIHWKRRKLFPLIAVRQTNGNYYWYSKPDNN